MCSHLEKRQADIGLHCMIRHIFLKIVDKNSVLVCMRAFVCVPQIEYDIYMLLLSVVVCLKLEDE